MLPKRRWDDFSGWSIGERKVCRDMTANAAAEKAEEGKLEE